MGNYPDCVDCHRVDRLFHHATALLGVESGEPVANAGEVGQTVRAEQMRRGR